MLIAYTLQPCSVTHTLQTWKAYRAEPSRVPSMSPLYWLISNRLLVFANFSMIDHFRSVEKKWNKSEISIKLIELNWVLAVTVVVVVAVVAEPAHWTSSSRESRESPCQSQSKLGALHWTAPFPENETVGSSLSLWAKVRIGIGTENGIEIEKTGRLTGEL